VSVLIFSNRSKAVAAWAKKMTAKCRETAQVSDVTAHHDEYIEIEYMRRFLKRPSEENCERVKNQRLKAIEEDSGLKWSGRRDKS